MVSDVLALVPPWVLVGVALGSVASVGVAVVFYLGNRLSPPASPESDATGVSGHARRHREIRQYLRDVDERFSEEHALGGVTVPFYLPEREVAITFDAHDYFQLEGEGVYAILCEHEMPGRGLGRRLPFEVAEPESHGDPNDRAGTGGVDPRTRGSDPSLAAAFDELGLPTDADADRVQRAYRERVKEVHPDQGGDEAAFRRLREAYDVASEYAEGDADRRRPEPGFGRR